MDRCWNAIFTNPWLGRAGGFLAAIAIAVGLIGLSYLLSIALPLPAEFFALEPKFVDFGDSSQRVSVALTRLACLVLWVIVFLLVVVFGKKPLPLENRRPKTVVRANGPPTRQLLQKRKIPILHPWQLRTMHAVTFGVVWIILSGILLKAEAPVGFRVAAIVSAAILSAASGVVLVNVSVRLMRIPFWRWWGIGVHEWTGLLMLSIGFAVALWLGSRDVVEASKWLSHLGPVGFLMSSLQGIAEGEWTGVLTVLASSGGLLVISHWIARDAHLWSRRRQMLQAHDSVVRRPEPIEFVSISSNSLTDRSDWKQAVRAEFRRSLRGRRFRDWRTWFFPDWLQQYLRWYLIALSCALVYQVLFLVIHYSIGEIEWAKTVGTSASQDRQLERQPFVQFVIPLLAVFAAGEFIAVLRFFLMQPLSLEQRPLNAGEFWWQMQIDGITRTPVLVLMTVPVWFPIFLRGRIDMAEIATAMFAMFGGLLIARTYLAGYLVLKSLHPLQSWYVRNANNAAFGITLIATVITLPLAFQRGVIVLSVMGAAVALLFLSAMWQRTRFSSRC